MTTCEALMLYRAAARAYGAVEGLRDEALAPVDAGMARALGREDERYVEHLATALVGLYPALQVAEEALVAYAQGALAAWPELLDLQPTCALLARPQVPPGRWAEAVELAIWVAEDGVRAASAVRETDEEALARAGWVASEDGEA